MSVTESDIKSQQDELNHSRGECDETCLICRQENNMLLNDKQREEMTEAAKPLIKWLNDNCHPHITAIVGPGCVELLEGISSVPVTEFIKD